MLLQLNIVNFALIENLSISFQDGFNVFTGETGAGKSILIDAINYVLGSKFNKDLIRTGENKTFVEAIFTIENNRTKEILRDLDIEFDDLVIISRETFSSGRSIVKVNGKSIIITLLKQLTSSLIDIHGQHENQNLLNDENHLNYLDYFAQDLISKPLNNFREYYQEVLKVRKKLSELRGDNGEREKLLSYLKYQIDEITNAKIIKGEEEQLNERFHLLTNSEKISKTLNYCYEGLYNGGESSYSVYDNLGSIIKDLKSLESYFDKIKPIVNSLEEVYYVIEQNISEIRSLKDKVYYDEDELSSINNRIYELNRLKKKYGEDIDGILSYKEKIEQQYNEFINREDLINDLEKKENTLISNCNELCNIITDIRKSAALSLQEKIMEQLKYVGLEKSVFNIKVEQAESFNFSGKDVVEFLISTNPGEPLKSLGKVASGGELSRIMLALKTVFVDKDKIPTVIFDEIDTGISGRIAQRVAEKMFLISKSHQVFCVTHLPQIASMSDNHFLIYKEVKGDKTYTYTKPLQYEEKQYEVAKMIGSSEVTEITLQNAKELITFANNIKEKI